MRCKEGGSFPNPNVQDVREFGKESADTAGRKIVSFYSNRVSWMREYAVEALSTQLLYKYFAN